MGKKAGEAVERDTHLCLSRVAAGVTWDSFIMCPYCDSHPGSQTPIPKNQGCFVFLGHHSGCPTCCLLCDANPLSKAAETSYVRTGFSRLSETEPAPFLPLPPSGGPPPSSSRQCHCTKLNPDIMSRVSHTILPLRSSFLALIRDQEMNWCLKERHLSLALDPAAGVRCREEGETVLLQPCWGTVPPDCPQFRTGKLGWRFHGQMSWKVFWLCAH